MADMRITGTRGGSGLPPEERKTDLTTECQDSITHVDTFVKGVVFPHLAGATFDVTDPPQVARKINGLFFH